MRLIDADKMKIEVINQNPLVKMYAKEIEEWRDSQPTVDAIPVEWIRHYKSIYGLTYSTLCNLLGTMLEDWEKEND